MIFINNCTGTSGLSQLHYKVVSGEGYLHPTRDAEEAFEMALELTELDSLDKAAILRSLQGGVDVKIELAYSSVYILCGVFCDD